MNTFNQTFQALADPTRRAILEMLSEGNMAAGEIAARFAISAPSVSHHLSVLKAADLVSAERQGQIIMYSLNTTVMQEVLQEVLRLFRVGAQQEPSGEEGHA